MKKSVRKAVTAGLVSAALLGVGAGAAYAETVYYKDTPVSWDHGRFLKVFSYSDVQSSIYEHVATANTTSSGWQEPGVQASAKQFVGTGHATAFWDCRG